MVFSTQLFSPEGIIFSLVTLGLMIVVYELKVRRKASPTSSPTSSKTNIQMSATDSGSYPKPLVVCGPSGVGKGTLLGMIFRDYPEHFAKSISHTTRAPRQGEVDGVHYHFTDKDTMEREIAEGKFVEYAAIHGQIYGTGKSSIERARKTGKICVLEVDVQGAQSIRASGIEFNSFFVEPPSFESLEDRLKGRGTESSEKIRIRLATARAELDFARNCDIFDFKLVNSELNQCYAEFTAQLFQLYPHLKHVNRK